MKRAKWGCLSVVGLTALAVVALLIWAYRPPRLEVPERQYPPNNAYEKLAAIAERLNEIERSTPRLQMLSRRAHDTRAPAPMPAADHADYARAVEPLLREYRRYLDAPSKVVMQYDPNNDPFFGIAPLLRNLARAENYFIRTAFARNRQEEVVERATALVKYSNQVSRDGAMIHYLVGAAVRSIALDHVRKNIERLNNRAALERLLRWAQEDERHRPAFVPILETEHHYNRAMTMRMYRNPQPMDPASPQWWETMPLLPQIYIKTSIPEMEWAWGQIKAYAAKPAWERKPGDFPRVRHPLNDALLPVFAQPINRRDADVAVARLLGCVAAIRLHKQRTGRYPDSLEALNLGELTIDPFTGKPFIYKVDPRKGVLIYSVGVNKRDDGGIVAERDWYGEQGDLAIQPTGTKAQTDLWLK